MEQTEGKLKSLPLVEKLKLIEIIESGRSVKQVAEEYAINRNTLHYILKNKDRIRDALNTNPGTAGFKRIKSTKSPELEMRVLNFMHESRSRNERLSGSIIKGMALEIAIELNLHNFAASNGWLFSFFKRNQISINDFNQVTSAQRFDNEEILEFEEELTSSNYQQEEVEESRQEFDQPLAQPDQIIESYEYSEEVEEFVETENVKDEGTAEDETLSEPAWVPDWRDWCRMCGNRETSIEIDKFLAEVAKQFFDTPLNILKICTECCESLEHISKMMSRVQLVDSMFIELEEREKEQRLNEEDLEEIRRQFGLLGDETETEVDYLDEEPMEEHVDTEEIVYDDVESLTTCEELEVGPEEHIEFDTIEEQIDVSSQVSSEIIETDSPKQSSRLKDEDSYEYKCHICGVNFERMFSLSSHTRNVHHSLPKVACSCGRYLSTWESLMTHKRKHSSEENSFSCSLCNSTFRTSSGLKIHNRFKHEKVLESLACLTCGREFKDKNTLKSHERTHLPDEEKYAHECDICGKRMVTQWSLKHHIKAIHEKSVSHFCHLCGRGFADKSNLRSHLISHTTENVTCEVCGGRFKNRVSLQSHRKIHKPMHSRSFACEVCDKGFHNRNHLNRHMISHSDQRSFKCTFINCPNEYKWQKDLTNHVASVHTGDRPHKCPFCDRTFVDNANLRKHKMKDHAEELEAYETLYGKRRRSFHQYQEIVE